MRTSHSRPVFGGPELGVQGLPLLPRCRRALGRAWNQGRPRHRVPMDAALHPLLADSGLTLPALGRRPLVRQRDVCEGRRTVALRLPGHRSARPDHRRLSPHEARSRSPTPSRISAPKPTECLQRHNPRTRSRPRADCDAHRTERLGALGRCSDDRRSVLQERLDDTGREGARDRGGVGCGCVGACRSPTCRWTRSGPWLCSTGNSATHSRLRRSHA